MSKNHWSYEAEDGRVYDRHGLTLGFVMRDEAGALIAEAPALREAVQDLLGVIEDLGRRNDLGFYQLSVDRAERLLERLKGVQA